MKELVAQLDGRARTEPDAVLAIDADGPHTLAGVLRAADSLAVTLTEVCGPRATVLLQADNSWRTVVAAVAVGRVGGTLALISRHGTRQELVAACEDIEPDAIVTASGTAAEWDVAGLRPAPPVPVLDGWSLAGGPARPAGRWAGGVVIGLTSGSTGRAKGVVQSEAALRYACRSTIDAVGLRPGDTVAALVPLSSAASVCFGLYLPLMLGGTVLLLDRWDPAGAVAAMAGHDVRWAMCVPTMALQMGTEAEREGMLTAMTAMTVGGGPMDAGALGRAERRLGTRILRVFGMSECLGHTTSLPSDPADRRLGTDGTPLPGTTLRAVDESGVPLPARTAGRAQVRGPSLFAGYARAGAVDPPELTAEGFFPTGDVVEVGDDRTVSIRGREKDIIIRGGRNIDITEIEFAVARHPQVEQVCVVPVPDDVLGERIALLTVTDRDDLDLTEIQRHLADTGLAKGKWPEYVFRVDALPQNRVGKLSRVDAARIARELRSAATA
ncbi:2,3-dihydroxybenzoate-AMP ligase [Pseudonocardia sp. Ae168_Ps1]|uniref:class I adenylate-forming enzyme family protein n=1 Tax=unclassified Pseudonocardia TaxID=2619320 RepID=UPI00094B16B8|nr:MULTISPECIES: fatty acid--CoA ligase family protein [unclassified Pseudonocardia]OLL73691.1 2,3-dihydroxybenzoate-AMP ligase [Pseudonocardia sp. Ae150A_Ps1]OLL79669.1 2,3-dihydroxybenzoate-AMP ligase [Pseudonocardia sp. Ae168_Ps1]OLL86195.1 2,3-dihydroxybenzoate-AMP ligase [Pseudonocardia sp. Ae263_Ps1]OLL93774.1 2,3-dihydroxybenzoate-AMP ligase [Pseudonocardia sp. Ae356_Ps1]